jgi:acyl-phosphate glycerol 3-phosphate acyltransferase
MPEGLFGLSHLANLALTAALAYLVGGTPFGLLVGKMVAGKDVRKEGSGNIGATNVGRVLGFKWFVVVFLLDLLKGVLVVLAAAAVQRICHDSVTTLYLPEVAALAAVLGHVFPIYLNFKGGKGVATSVGVLLALAWQPAVTGLVCFLVLFGATRYVSAGSIGFAVTFAATYFLLVQDPWRTELRAKTFLAVAAPLVIIVAHRGNIVRLLQGRENRIGGTKPSETARD